MNIDKEKDVEKAIDGFTNLMSAFGWNITQEKKTDNNKLDEDIEILKDYDLTIAIKIKNVLDHISDTVKQNGDMSQFKEDVMYVIHTLLEKQLKPQELTVCEITMKRQEYEIQRAKENYLEDYISKLKTELETYKQYYEEQNEVNKKFVSKDKFDEVNSELETYKKIAELFGKSLINISGEKTSLEELIDWAKREVENENRN